MKTQLAMGVSLPKGPDQSKRKIINNCWKKKFGDSSSRIEKNIPGKEFIDKFKGVVPRTEYRA
jgi:hypothetical protein